MSSPFSYNNFHHALVDLTSLSPARLVNGIEELRTVSADQTGVAA